MFVQSIFFLLTRSSVYSSLVYLDEEGVSDIIGLKIITYKN